MLNLGFHAGIGLGLQGDLGGKGVQLAFLGVFAVITQVDGPVASGRQECVVSCLARLGHNGDTFLVAWNEHSHMIRHLHLPRKGNITDSLAL